MSQVSLSVRYFVRIYHKCEGGIGKNIPRITIWHLEAFQVMTNDDPEGQIFLSHPQTNNKSSWTKIHYEIGSPRDPLKHKMDYPYLL